MIVRYEEVRTPVNGLFSFGYRVSYRNVVQFHVRDRDIEFADWLGAKWNHGNRTGTQVPVLYSQDDPTVAAIEHPIATSILLAGIALGVFLILVAILGSRDTSQS